MGSRWVVLVGLLVGLLGVPVAAAASCAAPEFVYDAGPVHPGDTVTVVGQFWGDDCSDTGNHPAGEGVLGLPRTGIVVVFVQGGAESIVARGDADTEYQFRVDVVVPDTAVVGQARLVARVGDWDGYDASRGTLTVASDGDGSPASVTSFGPADQPAPGSAAAPSPPDSPASAPASHDSDKLNESMVSGVGRWWPADTAIAVLIVGGLYLRPRRQQTSRSN